MKKKSSINNTIALNKKARHDYHLISKFEAGLELQGWEVKSIRAGKANITDAYVYVKNGEAFVTNISIQALTQASSLSLIHISEPTRPY